MNKPTDKLQELGDYAALVLSHGFTAEQIRVFSRTADRLCARTKIQSYRECAAFVAAYGTGASDPLVRQQFRDVANHLHEMAQELEDAGIPAPPTL